MSKLNGLIAGSVFILSAALLSACSDDAGDDSMGDDEGITATFTVAIEQVGQAYAVLESGVFDTPVGADGPGVLLPGGAYEFEVHAAPGHHLSFATMMVQSNDLFYAPDPGGIALFDEDGMPVTGDVTSAIGLWDAGTEINQEPGVGEDQAPHQSGPDTGAADPDDAIRPAEDAFSNLPAIEDVLQVTVTHEQGDTFTVRIENVSDEETLQTSLGSVPVPLAPGVWAVHNGEEPIFHEGMADAGDGLEALAEDGDPSMIAETIATETGLTAPLAPGVWAVQQEIAALFDEGMSDTGEGLEALAEDGDPSSLATALMQIESGVFDTPDGADDPGPLLPGGVYSFTFEAAPGDRLFFASMFVQSNDLFYGPGEEGIALFDADDMPIAGDITAEVMLWDAGTEVNQRPGTGTYQPLYQTGPNSGEDENGDVMMVDDGFDYPAVADVIRVTVESM